MSNTILLATIVTEAARKTTSTYALRPDVAQPARPEIANVTVAELLHLESEDPDCPGHT
jgi:hypothetical protein